MTYEQTNHPAARDSSPGLVQANKAKDALHLSADGIPAMLGIIDGDGRPTFLNRRWLDYIGAENLEKDGSALCAYVHPEDADAASQNWKSVTANTRELEMQLRLRRHDGVYLWHLVRTVPYLENERLMSGGIVLATDIDEQKRSLQSTGAAHDNLNRANEELEQTVAERTKELQEVVEQLESFAYSIAHDMRAPLRAIHQYASTVTEEFASRVPQEARVYLRKIMASSEKLDTLIREVLVYTRLSQGRIEMQPVNLERLLSEILTMYPDLSPPKVELSAQLPLQAVIGDETALTQVFSNLLTNAVKFVPTNRKPTVKIWTEVRGENVRVYVNDNGVGIPAQDKDRIFKMFERLQPESKYQGSGIGLTIVRRAVQRMGGACGR